MPLFQHTEDLIIIGSGPAGLAAAVAAKEAGIGHLILERGTVADTVHKFPLRRLLFSSADELQIRGGDLVSGSKLTREEILSYYQAIVKAENIVVRVGEDVTDIRKDHHRIQVETARGHYSARAVLAAIGGFGRQRQLGVPGEFCEYVSHRFVEASNFSGKRVLVVGAGNSAAEAALALATAGANVTVSVRRPVLKNEPQGASSISSTQSSPIKHWVLEPLLDEERRGRITILTSSRVIAIRRGYATLKNGASDHDIELECDHVFVLIGADPETGLLERAGVLIAADGRPVYDEQTCETNVPGIYVAGHLTRERHIKNAVLSARRAVYNLSDRLREEDVIPGVLPQQLVSE